MNARALAIVLALALAASAFGVVTAQHRTRSLFVELERAQQRAAALAAEGNRLRVEQARLLQPAAVDAAARQLGLKPIDAAHTVFLPMPGSAHP
ncbi:MAG TPA: cell division protein FtsL [Burkholderiaceae bacterium]|jgi:cell division protein FtsL|nr:cell division protein FtsL [Burkholderiaceae bacterium]